MIQAEIKIFKTIVKIMFNYYFDEIEENYNEMIKKLKDLNVKCKSEKAMSEKFDVDKMAIYEAILKEKLGEEEFIKDLAVDFRIDLSPTYICDVKPKKSLKK